MKQILFQKLLTKVSSLKLKVNELDPTKKILQKKNYIKFYVHIDKVCSKNSLVVVVQL